MTSGCRNPVVLTTFMCGGLCALFYRIECGLTCGRVRGVGFVCEPVTRDGAYFFSVTGKSVVGPRGALMARPQLHTRNIKEGGGDHNDSVGTNQGNGIG